MDALWAPWRHAYVSGSRKRRCIFCGRRRPSRTDRTDHIIGRTAHAFAMLNRYPYNNGHLMIAPYRHVPGLDRLTDEELLDLMKLVTAMQGRIAKHLKPHGMNIGVNIGEPAGAGFAGHVHVHIVPRWTGDTNFMPVLADTKVVSASLDAMRDALTGKKR